MSNANRLKKSFIRELETDARVLSIEKSIRTRSRTAWDVETKDSVKRIWVSYSKFAGDPDAQESPFYGSTWDSINDLRVDV